MERNFTNENFEGFLRQNAEGLRMRPSDNVWKGVSRHLNRRRRRIVFVLSVSLLTVSALGYYWLENSAHQASVSEVIKTNKETSVSITESGSTEQKLSTNNIPASGSSIATTGISKRNNVQPISTEFSSAGSFVISRVEEMLNNFNPPESSLFEEKDLSIDISSNTKDLNRETLPANNLEEEPLLFESSAASMFPKKKKSKLDWQIYFTPTISYRQLSENKTYQLTNPVTGVLSLDNINSAVTHKPAFGFEIGTAAKYPVSENIKLRAGLQFNINRYDIKAFSSNTQTATIMLNDRNGIDQVNTVSNYNNFTGYKTNWLENFYFQVSAPVGIEIKLKGDDKMQFGIASTIQPTYVLGDRAYLISSDYKNYAEVPWLTRRWNVNTNLETFVAYSTGQLKWQVGPQVRYQLLSSFVKEYPVKENLFDFGLKVGVSLNNQ
ncbi:MAG: hypothetical protein ACXWV9_04595 [Flavisolibacter sp.]